MTAKSDSSIAGCKGGYALLGLDLLQEGVTPTTAQIQVLKYGDAVTRGTGADGVHIVTAPVELLRDVNVVDTPGTNAIPRRTSG